MASSPIPIAIIGAGIFVKEQHLPAVLANPNLQIKAIYSRTQRSAQALQALLPPEHAASGKVDLYADDAGPGRTLPDLLGARPDIAGVLVALPIAVQPDVIGDALARGKHVLSEKPAGPDVGTARALLAQHRRLGAGATWSVAEQFRFLPKYVWGAEQARKLGRVIGFNFRVFQLVGQDNKYFKTDWRKHPKHNYGFVLDGGVHHAAVARMFLGDDKPDTVVGYSSLARDYLAPVDTLSAVIRTRGGAVGGFSCSWGSTMRATEYAVACENGSVTVEGDRGWVLFRDGRREDKDFPFTRGAGVKEEVEAWAAVMAEGKADPLMTPEITLGDLELIEAMLRSADDNGAPKTLTSQ